MKFRSKLPAAGCWFHFILPFHFIIHGDNSFSSASAIVARSTVLLLFLMLQSIGLFSSLSDWIFSYCCLFSSAQTLSIQNKLISEDFFLQLLLPRYSVFRLSIDIFSIIGRISDYSASHVRRSGTEAPASRKNCYFRGSSQTFRRYSKYDLTYICHWNQSPSALLPLVYFVLFAFLVCLL